MLLTSCIVSATSRESVCLNENWDFAYGYEVKKGVWEHVDIPHTWNNEDALNAQLDYYRGEGIYRKVIDVRREWKNERLFLCFEGVNTVANVFINGKHIGEHRGGYTAFNFEITDAVQYGAENEITVRVSNALFLDVMPLLGDFNFYGGIYRNVSLLRTAKTCISPLDYASSGIYLLQKNVSREKAEVEATLMINALEGGNYNLELTVRDGTRDILSKQQSIVLDERDNRRVMISFLLENPHLWNGLADPFIYTVRVQIKKEDQVIDAIEQPLGLRYFSVDADNGFFLNGEHLQLRGVCRHQDRSEVGNALLPEHDREDLSIILEMGANAIRLSHYPHSFCFYDLLDSVGLIAWSEIPFVGPGGYRNKGYVDMLSFRENGKLQLTEMIKQNYNRPSVCFWGLFNELKEEGDNPYDYLKELNILAHHLDPSRLTTAASNIEGEINEVTNLIAWNRYYGWYEGKPRDIAEWADKTHKNNTSFNIGISEYGAGAGISQHDSVLRKPFPSGKWHPEDWQAYYHGENWKAIDARPYIWGSFIWNMFDFGAAHRTEGERNGFNDKGLVTFDRSVKKDAFWFYKANWNKDEPTLYIANRRFDVRQNPKTDIKVYANYEKVELWVNGVSQGEKNGNYATFIWKDRHLQTGKNTIVVKAGKGSEARTDSCVWEVR